MNIAPLISEIMQNSARTAKPMTRAQAVNHICAYLPHLIREGRLAPGTTAQQVREAAGGPALHR